MGSYVSQQAFLPPYPLWACKDSKSVIWLHNKFDHEIPALYLKRNRRPQTLLFSHGNAEDITHISYWMGELSEQLQCSVLAYEYSGYADTPQYNTGKVLGPSEEFCYANGEAAYDYLVNSEKIDPSNIIVFGRSLGSGPAVELASKN